jgi:cytochrome c peroxidase
MPVHLGPTDSGRASATFDQMAQSIAGYEASAEVTPFTSKFDAVLAVKAQFTTQEQAGYDLFRGKAQCNACHRDGGPGEDPLFTSPPVTSEPLPIRGFLTTQNIGQTHWAMSPIRQGHRSSMAASAIFSLRGICSASLPGRSAMAQAGARQPRAISGADAAQCGQAASRLCEGLQA